MLDDLSKHVLDIAENSMAAGARRIVVTLQERDREGWVELRVEDDGCGMDPETVARVTDPFVTSRTTRRVGLGIPFLKQVAELCDGELHLASEKGKGTTLAARFRADAVDCPPLGDLAATVVTLLAGSPDRSWTFRFFRGDGAFEVDRDALVEILEDPRLFQTPAVAHWVRNYVEEGLTELRRPGN